MANIDNLRVPSSEEARKNGAVGGRASGQSRRRTKAMCEVLEAILAMPLTKGTVKKLKSLDELLDEEGNFVYSKCKVNITVEQAILLAQVVAALLGSTKAATFLRDTAGQKIINGADEQTEYEDDGFTEAIKRSAKDVWK